MSAAKAKLVISGFLPGMIAFWLVPYNETKLAGISIYYILLALLIVAAINQGRKSAIKPAQIAGWLTLGVLLAQCCRITYDTLTLDQSHNLLPLEIALAIFVAFPGSFIAAYAAKRISQKK